LLVNIDVDDLKRGVAFYTAAFELIVGWRLGSAVVELRSGTASCDCPISSDTVSALSSSALADTTK